METLQYAIYTAPGGALIADYSSRVQGLTFATNARGLAECTGFVPMSLAEAFALYDRPGLPHVLINDSAGASVFEGRLEDVSIAEGGVNLTAMGYARSLSDSPYTALWSSVDVSEWRPFLASESAGCVPDRFAFNTTNRLYITAQKNATLGNTGTGKYAMLGFLAPDQGSRGIIGVSFDYVYSLPVASWRVAFQTRNADFTGIANPWLFTSVGATGVVTGNVFLTFASAQIVNFFMDYDAADAVFSGETGSAYLIITNVRLVTSTTNKVDTTSTANVLAGSNVSVPVVSSARMYVGQRLHMGIPAANGFAATVLSIPDSTHFTADLSAAMASGGNVQAHVIYADEIVKDIVSTVSTLNPTQLSSSTTLIQSPSLDLQSESYQDMYPSDILDYLAKLGDSQTTPRQWEWGVIANRQLYFRPQSSAARTWYIDISELDVQRTLDALYNSIYADYQEPRGRTLRSSTNTDSGSVARYGLTRRRVQSVQTTSSTQAGIQRDAVLADSKDPKPKSGVTVAQLYDANGNRWPLTAAHAGDTVIIRNLPPSLSTAIDRIRVFRLTRTEYHIDDNTVTLEPEAPLSTLESQLALSVPPSWVTTPWWIQVAQK